MYNLGKKLESGEMTMNEAITEMWVLYHIKNVISLFDGCSCGQEALRRAGIKCENYYASEIDKNAIKVTMKNFPNTIQLGDIRDVDTS